MSAWQVNPVEDQWRLEVIQLSYIIGSHRQTALRCCERYSPGDRL